mgnify:CR=1 FL=1
MTWAYSPSYGKPLSVPQGVIALMTRFGMDVVLAHPEGYEVMEEVENVARENAAKSGGSFTKTNSILISTGHMKSIHTRNILIFHKNNLFMSILYNNTYTVIPFIHSFKSFSKVSQSF